MSEVLMLAAISNEVLLAIIGLGIAIWKTAEWVIQREAKKRDEAEAKKPCQLTGRVEKLDATMAAMDAHLERLAVSNEALQKRVDELQEKRLSDKENLYERVIAMQDAFATRIESGLGSHQSQRAEAVDTEDEYDEEYDAEDAEDNGDEEGV